MYFHTELCSCKLYYATVHLYNDQFKNPKTRAFVFHVNNYTVVGFWKPLCRCV